MSDNTNTNFDEMSREELVHYCKDNNLANGRELYRASKENLVALAKGEILQLPKIEATENSGEVETVNESELETMLDANATAPASKPNATMANPSDPMSVLSALGQLMGASTLNEDGVKKIVEDYVTSDAGRELIRKNATIKKVMVSINKSPAIEIKGKTHKKFKEVLELAAMGLPIFLVGPAGTGKTFLARQVAGALNRPFTFSSMSAGVTEAQMKGRMLPQKDGTFEFVKGAFARTYENGGVHLFDEVDAADPNMMTHLNAAIANHCLECEGGNIIINRHPDTVLMFAANTYGTGASRQYVGRNQLDAATLDRFAMSTIEIGYDDELERELSAQICGDDDTILHTCWHIRRVIEENHMRRIMSTRSLIAACTRYKNGATRNQILNTYFLPWTKEERAKTGL